MRFKDFKGRPVVTLDNAETVGQVSELLLDFTKEQVRGLRVNMNGLFSGHRDLAWGDIRAIGQDAVTVANGDALKEDSALPDIANLPDVGDVTGSSVMGEAGNQIGTVSDVEFDTSSGAITGYVLSEGFLSRLQGIVHIVPASDVQSISKNMLVVSDEIAQAGTSGGQ